MDSYPGVAWARRLEVTSIFGSQFGVVGKPPFGALYLQNVNQGPADDLTWLTTGVLTPVRTIAARLRTGAAIEVGTLDSTTPVLRWELPRTGLANRYYVQPSEGDQVTFRVVDVTVVSDRNEAHIPPGVLQPGTNYVFVVQAENCTAADPARPRRQNLQATCALSEARSYRLRTASQ